MREVQRQIGELPPTAFNDPNRVAAAILTAVDSDTPPVRLVTGGFAVTEIDGDWLRVEIPARPNSQEGWVRAADVTLSESEFRMELTLSDYTLRVFQGDEVVVETQVVIGRPNTPTPVGTFFLGEVLSAQQAGVGNPAGAYGPYILATSAYSETLDLFDGGLPVIAFHGTNQPGLIGTQSSNGCVRMPNDVVTELAGMLPAGTVITVTA